LETSQRALITDNRASIPVHVAAHAAAGRRHWGIFEVRKDAPLGPLAELIYLYWEVTEAKSGSIASSGAPKRIDTAGFACPTCAYYRMSDAQVHALSGDGAHGKCERIQTLRCQACGTTVGAAVAGAASVVAALEAGVVGDCVVGAPPRQAG
jgi:hypothetical protein